MNLSIITQAVLRTVYARVMQVLVANRNFLSVLAAKNFPNASVQAREVSKASVNSFGTIQKNTHGLDLLMNNILRLFSDRMLQAPDAVVVPHGVLAYISTCKPESRVYALCGTLAERLEMKSERELVTNVYNNAYSIFEHRPLNVSNDTANEVNMLTREREVGNYFRLFRNTEASSILPGGSSPQAPSQTSIRIIDHDKQRWHTITLSDALDHSGLFNQTTGDIDFYGPLGNKGISTFEDLESQNLLTERTIADACAALDSVSSRYGSTDVRAFINTYINPSNASGGSNASGSSNPYFAPGGGGSSGAGPSNTLASPKSFFQENATGTANAMRQEIKDTFQVDSDVQITEVPLLDQNYWLVGDQCGVAMQYKKSDGQRGLAFFRLESPDMVTRVLPKPEEPEIPLNDIIEYLKNKTAVEGDPEAGVSIIYKIGPRIFITPRVTNVDAIQVELDSDNGIKNQLFDEIAEKLVRSAGGPSEAVEESVDVELGEIELFASGGEDEGDNSSEGEGSNEDEAAASVVSQIGSYVDDFISKVSDTPRAKKNTKLAISSFMKKGAFPSTVKKIKSISGSKNKSDAQKSAGQSFLKEVKKNWKSMQKYIATDPYGSILSKRKKSRLRKIGGQNTTQPVRVDTKKEYLSLPVTAGVIRNLDQMGIVTPFGCFVFRPFQSFTMGSAVIMKSGNDTGFTCVGNSDFQLVSLDVRFSCTMALSQHILHTGRQCNKQDSFGPFHVLLW